MSERNEWGDDDRRVVRPITRALAVLLVAGALAACGDAPFESLGEASANWISEPTVIVTTTVPVTVPVVIGSSLLKWFNDTIVTIALDDQEALLSEIFARRGGELIVQVSRAEISTLLPEVKFPAVAPSLGEYVTSQVVFNGTGALSNDPTVGFGIWSSEPYTRSRSVAQIVVLQVATDQAGATEVSESAAEISCARFADRTTVSCEILDLDGVPVWSLLADNGQTLVWYDEIYRYELFGRTFVPVEALIEMVPTFTPLSGVTAAAG
ncbi:MAG: hypothetical protein O6951_06300 [Actinobacteria bacterium]|nr:hypothetical protein [Actinomycetota bacterium]